MKSIEQERQELEQKYQKSLAEAERKYRVLSLLPPDLLAKHEWSCYSHGLYDRVGSLTLKYQRYSSIKEGENATLQSIRELSEAFPRHEPLTLYREGSVGVRTASNADAMHLKNEGAILTPMSPFYINIEPSEYSQELTVKWIAEIAGEKFDIAVEFSIHATEWRKLGTLQLNYRHDRNGEVRGLLTNSFEVSKELRVLGNATARQIKYSSGDPMKTPGHHLIYWETGNGEHPSCCVEDLVTALESCS